MPRRPAAALLALLVLAGVGASAARAAARPPARVAPYVDMGLYPTPSLSALARSSGLRRYTLAFVVADGGCRAAWAGITPVSGRPFESDIAALRHRGGDVIVSFGGENGSELAQSCSSVSALSAQYNAVIATYRLSSIDFDIEGAAVADGASITRRAQAIAAVERTHPKLEVSFTLPVLPSGLDHNGLAVVRAAVRAHDRISVVNLMAMDFGDYSAPAGTPMGTYAERAANAVHHQLGAVLRGHSSAALWRMIGDTPMIGVNDTSDEVFGLSDARSLTGFARRHHLGRLAFWSATRDRQCPGGAKSYAEDDCSSVLEGASAFSRAFSAFSG